MSTQNASLSNVHGPSKDAWIPFSKLKSILHLNRNQIIYQENDRADYFYYILSGKIRTYISSEKGTERTLNIYDEGSIFGEAAFFDGKPRMSSARTLTESYLVSIDRDEVSKCFERDSNLVFAMLEYLAGTVRMLSEHVDSQAFLTSEERIIQELLHLSDTDNEITVTHEEIGDAVGASRVTVSRILSKLESQGLIECGYRKITILNKNRMHEILPA